ncbi:hypothetical protein [Polyangium sp. 15x6]|uniref:hypothetical protein n=1 Tax=Polyangium sp. 15x6 TaxID=3042687 RepID=UPI00249A11D8|nr:hypothetical protein [Polyangium sp. 15x6]MDI3291881.1 hypothetical protein [Polyangium sp. 15x6]
MHAKPRTIRDVFDVCVSVVRIVSRGRTPDAHAAQRNILLDVFTHKWPIAKRTKCVITPGGFVRAPWPKGVLVPAGWHSRAQDLEVLTNYAETVLVGIVTEDILLCAMGKADVLTIGIDVLNGPGGIHTELVAVYDVSRASIIRWTGKSYPTPRQERTLVHVVDLETHLLSMAGERFLVLGCHDLNMWSPRGRANQSPDGLRRKRCEAMKAEVDAFQPTIVLQHPHSTDSPNIWRLPWLSLAREIPSVRTWASGIAYYHSESNRERADFERVLALTRSDERMVVDVVIDAADYG